MKISMVADFEILKNLGNGQFARMDDSEIQDVSIGGYTFEVGGYRVPFDWEAHEGGWDKEGFYSFDTGVGWFFKNYELDSCYDDCYAEMGLLRADITAAFLASAHHIDDFYINFVDKDGRECEAGHWKANGDPNAPYRLRLLKVQLEDIDSERVYSIDPKVIDAFNKGERLLGLDNVLGSAESRSDNISAEKFGRENSSTDELLL